MVDSVILLCIAGMSLVSYLPRVLPPFILAKTRFSPVAERWLKYVPTSVFGALVFSEIFIDGDKLNFGWDNVNLIASLIVLWVAAKTKSLGKSIVVGVTAYWILKRLL